MGLPVTEPFTVPETVRTCFSDTALTAAVEEILADRKFPAAIEWDEVESFLKARASAEAVRWDYSLALYQFFEAVWGDRADWIRDPVDMTVSDTGFAAAELWDDGEISVRYTDGDRSIYLLAGFDSGETWIGICPINKNGKAYEDWTVDGFAWDENEEYFMRSWKPSVAVDDQLAIEIKDVAREALKIVTGLYSAH